MIEKEISMYFIAYNCVRRLMNDAADEANIAAREVSFKGSVQVIRNWEPHLNQVGIKKNERSKLLTNLHGTITSKTICKRQGRSELRCKKRRPKNYQLMTVPRHEMREIPHRGDTVIKTIKLVPFVIVPKEFLKRSILALLKIQNYLQKTSYKWSTLNYWWFQIIFDGHNSEL